MSLGMNDATAMHIGDTSLPPTPSRNAPTPSRTPYSASGPRNRSSRVDNSSSTALVPHTAAESMALQHVVSESALARERGEVSRQEREIIRLKGTLSRTEDETESMKCKVLRLESALQSLTIEAGDAQAAARKAQSEADRQKRINMELSTTKSEVSASRQTIQEQLQKLNSEMIHCREDAKKAEDHREAAQKMYHNLRTHSLQLEAQVEELTQVRDEGYLIRRNLEEDLANAQSCLEAFRSNVGADMRRLTALLAAATQRMDTSAPFADDDQLVPQVEELIYENSKYRATAPLYPELHETIRGFTRSLHAFRREHVSTALQLDRMATLSEDLTASLQENSVLSQRVAKVEAQMTLCRQHSESMERDGDVAKDGVRRVLQAISDSLGPNDSLQIPSGRGALAYVEEGIQWVEIASGELAEFKGSKTALQQQVVSLQNQVIEMKGDHRTQIHAIESEALRDLERAVGRATADGRELARAEAGRREKDSEEMYHRVSQQRDEASEAAARLRQECSQAHQDLQRAVMKGDACDRRVVELEKALDEERMTRGQLEGRLQEYSTELALLRRPSARPDQCSPLESLVGVLQALEGANTDRADAVAASKAMWKLVHTAYPPRHLFRCRPAISLILRFRVAVLVVIAGNRLMRIHYPKTSFGGSVGRRVRLLPSTAVRMAQSSSMWPISAAPATRTIESSSFLMPTRAMGVSKPADLIDFLLDQVRVPTRRLTSYKPPIMEAVGDGLATLLRNGAGPARCARRAHDQSMMSTTRADPNASRYTVHTSPYSHRESNYLIPEVSRRESARGRTSVISPVRTSTRRMETPSLLTVHRSGGAAADRSAADSSRFAADVLGVIESLNKGIESSLVRHRRY